MGCDAQRIRIGLAIGAAALAAIAGGGLTQAARGSDPAPVRAAATDAPLPPALDTPRRGLWTIRAEGRTVERLCLIGGADLVQLRHRGAGCSRLVVAAGAHDATIQYSCPGAGWGRTAITVDSADAVRLDTQGIADNAPFAYRAEARREGDCDPAGA